MGLTKPCKLDAELGHIYIYDTSIYNKKRFIKINTIRKTMWYGNTCLEIFGDLKDVLIIRRS